MVLQSSTVTNSRVSAVHCSSVMPLGRRSLLQVAMARGVEGAHVIAGRGLVGGEEGCVGGWMGGEGGEGGGRIGKRRIGRKDKLVTKN